MIGNLFLYFIVIIIPMLMLIVSVGFCITWKIRSKLRKKLIISCVLLPFQSTLED